MPQMNGDEFVQKLREFIEQGEFAFSSEKGRVIHKDLREVYIEDILSHIQ